MAGKRIVALWKAWRGGEWFGASLDSVYQHVDGIVVVFSEQPWCADVTFAENCKQPLREFRQAHPDFPVAVASGLFRRQEDQYAAGLALVRERFGEDAAVLIVDTDELWGSRELGILREAIERSPKVDTFETSIVTYLKSPLYQVWPLERGLPVVAIQSAREQPIKGRFGKPKCGSRKQLSEIAFHHFPYVRADEAEIAAKFRNTASQEVLASDWRWLTKIWPNLPFGKNLHMSRGMESCWREVKVLTPRCLPAGVADLPFVRPICTAEDQKWKVAVHSQTPSEAVYPVPTDPDRRKYHAELVRYLGEAILETLAGVLNMTWLEALWLMNWASQVPDGGRILEIGSAKGASACCMAMASRPSVMVTCIDPFVPYLEQTHAGMSHEVQQGTPEEFWDTARRCHVEDRLRLITEPSQSVRLEGQYDLFFVDGNHGVEYVRNDLNHVRPHVKPGGRVAGHDYTTRFPGVIAAVDGSSLPIRIPVGTSLFHARVS